MIKRYESCFGSILGWNFGVLTAFAPQSMALVFYFLEKILFLRSKMDYMIPNSIAGATEGARSAECLELYKRGTRNVLWLTVREGRRVILKGLPEELGSHPEEAVRLRKEYSLGLRVSHSGVA